MAKLQRPSSVESYRERMNLIMEYIANHLDEKIDLPLLAGLANFSPFHFHRITRAFLGEPIVSFITRVRLETAARLLRYTDISVADIAYKVGYDAPGSLTKAFGRAYGVSPSQFRDDKEIVILKPNKMDMNLNIGKCKVVDLPPKKLIYIKLFGEYSGLDYPGTWQRLWSYVKEHKLFSAGIEHIAIYHDDPKVTEGGKLRTDLCLAIHTDASPKGEIGVKEVEGGRYAMFLYKGPYSDLGSVYDTIYAHLLPETGLELRDSHCFEKYVSDPSRTEPENLKTEIYIPVE